MTVSVLYQIVLIFFRILWFSTENYFCVIAITASRNVVSLWLCNWLRLRVYADSLRAADSDDEESGISALTRGDVVCGNPSKALRSRRTRNVPTALRDAPHIRKQVRCKLTLSSCYRYDLLLLRFLSILLIAYWCLFISLNETTRRGQSVDSLLIWVCNLHFLWCLLCKYAIDRLILNVCSMPSAVATFKRLILECPFLAFSRCVNGLLKTDVASGPYSFTRSSVTQMFIACFWRLWEI